MLFIVYLGITHIPMSTVTVDLDTLRNRYATKTKKNCCTLPCY